MVINHLQVLGWSSKLGRAQTAPSEAECRFLETNLSAAPTQGMNWTFFKKKRQKNGRFFEFFFMWANSVIKKVGCQQT